MPRPEEARTRGGSWRIVFMATSAALGLVAVFLVVFGTSQKQLQVGVLLGLWGGLLAAFLVFGSRRSVSDPGGALAEVAARTDELHEAQLRLSELQRAQIEAAQEANSKQEIQLRRLGEIQLSREAAARREADLNLELSLRREIERMMNEQLGSLRDEVAALRAEVVDKLGGQLRLERIETTRLIGSDLEALQHEIRRLAGGQETVAVAPPAVSAPRKPATPNAPDRNRTVVTGRSSKIEDSDIVDAEVIETEPDAGEQSPSVVDPPVARGVQAERVSGLSGLDEQAGRQNHDDRVVGEPEPSADERVAEVPVTSAVPAAGSSPEVSSVAASTAAWSSPTVVGAVPVERSPEPVDESATSREPEQPARAIGSVSDEPVGARGNGETPLYRQSEQAAAFTDSFDPFAGLPRLSPVPDDIDLIQDPDPEVASAGPAEPEGRRRAPDDEPSPPPTPPRYQGRRRAGDEPESTAEIEAEAVRSGKRRAPDDAPDDLFQRLNNPSRA